MKVLTYIKDLPVKLSNENKNVLDLEGATLYLDEEANRYAYVCLNNLTKRPAFALILDLIQYDVGGHLIKKEKYYVPHCFLDHGKNVLEKPINIDKECEAMEINIALAIFSNRVFANDEIRKIRDVVFAFPRLSHNDPLMPRGTAANFYWPKDEDVKEETVTEEKPVEYKEVENPDFEVPSEEVKEDAPTTVKEEAPVEEAPVNEDTPKEETVPAEASEEDVSLPGKFVRPLPRKKEILLRVVLPIVVGLIALGLFLMVYFIVKGVVPSTPYRLNK